MAKERRPVFDWLVYVVVRLIVCVVQALPMDFAIGFARLLAKFAFRFDRRHREVARSNLQIAFPDRSAKQIDKLVRGVYTHFCRLIIEIALLPRKLHVTSWRDYMDLERGDRILSCLTDSRPTLIVTGHFGNWEMAGYALGLLGFKSFAIARTLDNPYLDKFLQTFRQKTGQVILDKNKDVKRMLQSLIDNQTVSTLADQDAGPRGVFVDFFGRPASTFKSVGLLCVEYKVPLLVIGVARIAEPMKYAIIAQDLIRPEEYADRPDAVKLITQRYVAALESMVRRYPEQYFWLHRRWKSVPAAKKAKAA